MVTDLQKVRGSDYGFNADKELLDMAVSFLFSITVISLAFVVTLICISKQKKRTKIIVNAVICAMFCLAFMVFAAF